MNIWLVQISEALPIDVEARKLRTSMLADALVSRGHNVIWWASAFNHLKKKWYFNKDTDVKISENFQIKMLHGLGYKSNLSISRLVDHRLLSWKFKVISSKLEKPDLIVCSLPSYDLAWRVMHYSKKYNIPLIIDVRDQWPDNFVDFAPVHLKKVFRFFLGHEIRMLKEALKGATAIISMSSGLLDWALSNASRPQSNFDKVFYLGFEKNNISTPKKEDCSRFAKLRAKADDYFLVTFIGTFGKYHDPRIMIECAKLTIGLKILYVLGGDGELNLELRESAKHLDNVVFLGWLNKNEATEVLGFSNIGVCSTSSRLNGTFFPNKVYSYWAAGLPTASAFTGELHDTIDRYNVGFNYSNLDQFVSGIRRLYFNPSEYFELSKNAENLFKKNYDAKKIYSKFACYLEEVLLNHKN